jgi:twitching motility two-component system response regulator PilH
MPKGSKVLMADDDKMLLDMYKERLELASYVVDGCSNGEEALAHVRDFNPDIILLDIMMPKMNGYETLASLKSDPTTKNIPVVMLSALMRDFNREKAVEGGAEDYLIKSEAMPSDVITKIEQVLQKYNQSSATAQPTQPVPAPMATPNTPPAAVQPVFEPVTNQPSISVQPATSQVPIAVPASPPIPVMPFTPTPVSVQPAPVVAQTPIVVTPASAITENSTIVPPTSSNNAIETPQAGSSI